MRAKTNVWRSFLKNTFSSTRISTPSMKSTEKKKIFQNLMLRDERIVESEE